MPDRKILRTRAGNPLRLMDLLEEAIAHAREVVDEARPDLDPGVRAAIAPQVGIGAVKYADLTVAHDSEYVFDLDRMVSLTGNTGPYLQYAAARIRSIFRTAAIAPAGATTPITLTEPAERALALALLEFGDVVVHVGDQLEPHRLCGYLFDLAQHFSAFYEQCPVLKADSEVRASRLALCARHPGRARPGPRPARDRAPRADVNALVWYVAYGSNLSQDRFACYLQGGQPAGARRSYPGCRDRTPPREVVGLRLPGRIRFGGLSRVWGGGLAFLDPEAADGEVVARGYLIGNDQLDEVHSLERRYDSRSQVGDRDGLPMVALTSSEHHEPAAPSAAYLRTILTGLTDGLLEVDAAITYLLSAPGVDLRWDEAELREMAEQPTAGRG